MSRSDDESRATTYRKAEQLETEREEQDKPQATKLLMSRHDAESWAMAAWAADSDWQRSHDQWKFAKWQERRCLDARQAELRENFAMALEDCPAAPGEGQRSQNARGAFLIWRAVWLVRLPWAFVDGRINV